MVRIDASYLIPAPREAVWNVLTRPEMEHEHTWLMSTPNEILERRPDGVRFRTRRDRKRGVGRPDAVCVFDGTFDRANWRVTWRILEGFEEGSVYHEELTEEEGGTRVRAHGRISLKGVEWDWRILGTIFPWRARATIERNVCRDYKRIKEMLASGNPAVRDPRVP
jgi:uncharacterized protein YndB with AHSA1/START domain